MITYQRRRDLLPFWMNFFIWAFLFLAACSAVIFIVYFVTGIFFGYKGASIYGMETPEIASPLGIFITLLLLFKVFIAFSLRTEKKWAVDLAILDAVLGIIICVYMMFVEPLVYRDGGHYEFNIRFELVFLIPYLIKCLKINQTWKNMKAYVPDPNAPKEKRVRFNHERKRKTEEIIEPEIVQPEQPIDQYIPKENINREDDEDYLKRYMPK